MGLLEWGVVQATNSATIISRSTRAAGSYLKTQSSFLFASSTMGVIQILASTVQVPPQNHRHLDCMLKQEAAEEQLRLGGKRHVIADDGSGVRSHSGG